MGQLAKCLGEAAGTIVSCAKDDDSQDYNSVEALIADFQEEAARSDRASRQQ